MLIFKPGQWSIMGTLNNGGRLSEENIILGGFNQNKNTFKAFYVDNLCVHKDMRNKGIAPKIIQTHEYIQRHKNKNICVSLFKREGNLTGIVPLTIYTTYQFICN